MGEEGNSSECPDKDKTHLRYRLDFLSVLHQKFLAESGHDCSFAQFCRLIPENIIKPKPTDWGTNLCMTCINPQLMLEGLKRAIKEQFNGLNLEDICDYFKKDLHKLMSKVGELKKNIPFLQWTRVKTTKEKKTGEAPKKKNTTTYRSEKQSLSVNSKAFAKKFLEEVNQLQEHNRKKISQYRRIREIRQIVADPVNDAAAIRIDWSENATLFQTRQEKSDYYHTTQVSINTVVSYQSTGVQSHATISDYTSHRAAATWTSLKSILLNLHCSRLYIISDSPTSQYRNAYNCYLAKKYAEEHNCEVVWVFTEVVHGKGPMDGVGGALKKKIDDVIAYRPNNVIRNTAQLVKALPPSEIRISTYTRADFDRIQDRLPKQISVKSSELGIASAHKVKFPIDVGSTIYLKEVSCDGSYKLATLHQKKLIRVNADDEHAVGD